MELKYLKDLWVESETTGMDEPELLRYRSNLLGRDLRLTNFGGGNTSAKLPTVDPVTGKTVEVLWVKGSGGDLGTIKRDGFATLFMESLNALKGRYRGVEHEDEMVDRYPLCTFGANTRATSIDTPLHGFLPYPHVDHLHPDWAIALAACANGPAQLERLQSETGLKLAWLPWKRPGFELGLWLQKCVEESPDLDGIILGSHGLFTWGPSGRVSYLKTIEVVDTIGHYVLRRVEAKGDALFGGQIVAPREDSQKLAAGAMAALRGLVGNVLGHFEGGADVLRFVDSARAKALAWQGTSCPDHFVRTKVRPLFVEWDAVNGTASDMIAAAEAAMVGYRADYAAYYGENRKPDSPAMRPPNPTVILVPGVGMFSFGKNKPEARITGEFYVNAIHVMEGATAMDDLPAQPGIPADRVVDNYVALPPSEAFGIEYWLLEEAKLQRMPREKELSRKVAVVVGASPGIGLAVADKLAAEGAHVAVADLRPELAQTAADSVRKKHGKETAIGATVDCTNRESVRAMLDNVAMQFGGVDILVFVAAVFFPPDSSGRITEEQWRTTFDVNLMGAMLTADEAHNVMQAQKSTGSIVLISSANGVVAKKGSWAYDTSKAGMNHLVRELAVEFSPDVRVNGVAPASVVEGSQQFPRDRVLSSLAKYGIAYDEGDSTEALRDRLSAFYSERTLLKRKVTPAGVAEAAFLLGSDRLALTTGQTIAVDAGLTEAFMR